MVNATTWTRSQGHFTSGLFFQVAVFQKEMLAALLRPVQPAAKRLPSLVNARHTTDGSFGRNWSRTPDGVNVVISVNVSASKITISWKRKPARTRPSGE